MVQALIILFGYLFVFLFLAFIGWLTGRLLGTRRGFWRAMLAGLMGYGAAVLTARAIWDDPGWVTGSDLKAYAAGGGYIVTIILATMLSSILIDLLLTPKADDRPWRPSIPHPIRAMKRKSVSAERVAEIGMTARRHGLISPKGARAALSTPEGAKALRQTLEDSGGMLVKFGQIASTREDLLPPVVTEELAKLRSDMPPLPYDVVKKAVESELGASLNLLFSEFEEKPLAAASIGVTHRAKLPDGRPVVVKVRRPGIEDIVESDGRVLRWAAGELEQYSGRAERLGIRSLANELIGSVRTELDFTKEASSNASMRSTRGDDPGMEFPEIILPLTTSRVLVMEMVEGRPVSDSEAVEEALRASGGSREQLANNLFRSFLNQVLRDGVFHADPHPGNVLVKPDGTIALIDYGAVGHMDPVTLEALQQIAIGFEIKDASILARAVRRLAGNKGESLDVAALEFDLSQVLSDVADGGFDPAALRAVVGVLSRHGIPAPQALTVLGRAALTLEGTIRQIDPDFRMAQRAKSQMGDILANQDMDPRSLLQKEVVRQYPVLRVLPQLTEDIALQTRAGRLTLRVNRFDGPDGDRMERWLDEIVFALMALGGFFGATMLILAGVLAEGKTQQYLLVIGSTGLVISSGMQMRTVARIINRRR